MDMGETRAWGIRCVPATADAVVQRPQGASILHSGGAAYGAPETGAAPPGGGSAVAALVSLADASGIVTRHSSVRPALELSPRLPCCLRHDSSWTGAPVVQRSRIVAPGTPHRRPG